MWINSKLFISNIVMYLVFRPKRHSCGDEGCGFQVQVVQLQDSCQGLSSCNIRSDVAVGVGKITIYNFYEHVLQCKGLRKSTVRKLQGYNFFLPIIECFDKKKLSDVKYFI